jgi:hypothetical protein
VRIHIFKLLIPILGIHALSRGCSKLRTFIAKGRLFIDNDSVMHLANHCLLLEVLNFNGAAVSSIVLIRNIWIDINEGMVNK